MNFLLLILNSVLPAFRDKIITKRNGEKRPIKNYALVLALAALYAVAEIQGFDARLLINMLVEITSGAE